MEKKKHRKLSDGPQKFYNEENSLIKWTIPERIFQEESHEVKVKEDTEKESELQKMLNSVLPPREWEEDSGRWRQKVSPENMSRKELIELSQRLDFKMTDMDAKNIGICDIRRHLHIELFDELTRQTVILMPEQGNLMLRVRDDLMMTMLCYQDLFRNSIPFGMKKAMEAEQGRKELEEIIDLLKVEKAHLEEEKKNAMKSVNEKESKLVAEKDFFEALHLEQMKHFESTNKAFQELLDSIMISKK